MDDYGTVLTRKGIALIAKMCAGGTAMTFSRAEVGDGEDDGAPHDTREGLIRARIEAGIKGVSHSSTQATVTLQILPCEGEGFAAREYGLYALDPLEGEVLYAYVRANPEHPEWVYSQSDPIPTIREISLVVVVGQVEQVAAQINYSCLATMEDVRENGEAILVQAENRVVEHNLHLQAHQDIRNHLGQIEGRIGRVEDMLLNDVTGNPFAVAFGDLNGLIVEGVWNEPLQRIEF